MFLRAHLVFIPFLLMFIINGGCGSGESPKLQQYFPVSEDLFWVYEVVSHSAEGKQKVEELTVHLGEKVELPENLSEQVEPKKGWRILRDGSFWGAYLVEEEASYRLLWEDPQRSSPLSLKQPQWSPESWSFVRGASCIPEASMSSARRLKANLALNSVVQGEACTLLTHYGRDGQRIRIRLAKGVGMVHQKLSFEDSSTEVWTLQYAHPELRPGI